MVVGLRRINSVIAVDIMPGSSPRSRRKARYALVYLKGGNILREEEGVGLHHILRLVSTLKPDCLAVDNIYELVGSSADLRRLLRSMPPGTMIVQVTGSPFERPEPLTALAHRHGLTVPSKLTPLQAARTIARLAFMGIGYYLKGFEEETLIIVSKRLTPSAGGMSMDRYERRVGSSIVSISNEIENALREAGLDYDVYPRGRGRVFVVYASREKLAGVVKPYNGYGVRVEVKPVPKETLIFEPLSGDIRPEPPKKYLIVGYDPGVRAGVAVLDLHSRLLLLRSGRFLTRWDVARMVFKLGKPVVVASDVKPSPKIVRKLASMFKAVLFEPPKDLRQSDKKRLVMDYLSARNIEVKKIDSHMIAALAAALRAFNYYKPKFEHIERVAGRVGVSAEEVKAMFLRGVKIKDAVDRLMKAQGHERRVRIAESAPADEVVDAYRRRIAELEEKLRGLESLISDLEDELRKRDNELRALNERLMMEREKADLAIKRDRLVFMLEERLKQAEKRIRDLESTVSRLTEKLKSYEEVARLLERELYIALVYIERLSPSALEEALKEDLLKAGRIVYVGNPGVVERGALKELLKTKPRAVMFPEKPSEWVVKGCEGEGVPVYVLGDSKPRVRVVWIGRTPFAERGPLEEFLAEAERRLREKNLREMRERLLRMIMDYKNKKLK